MPDEARRRDRLIGLFVFGLILFDPPLLNLFSGPAPLGWPLLYVYIFLAWGALIAAVAVVVEGRRRRPEDADAEER